MREIGQDVVAIEANEGVCVKGDGCDCSGCCNRARKKTQRLVFGHEGCENREGCNTDFEENSASRAKNTMPTVRDTPQVRYVDVRNRREEENTDTGRANLRAGSYGRYSVTKFVDNFQEQPSDDPP